MSPVNLGDFFTFFGLNDNWLFLILKLNDKLSGSYSDEIYIPYDDYPEVGQRSYGGKPNHGFTMPDSQFSYNPYLYDDNREHHVMGSFGSNLVDDEYRPYYSMLGLRSSYGPPRNLYESLPNFPTMKLPRPWVR